MRYSVNNSFSINSVNGNEQIVICDDSLRSFECDFDVLKTVLDLISASGDIDDVYKYYADIYDKETVSEFINTLIDEKVILPVTEATHKKITTAVIGPRENFNTISKLHNNSFEYTHFETADSFATSNFCFDGIIVLPGNMTYGEAVHTNKVLYGLGVPYVFCRYTGTDIIVGPMVFPWKTTCLECHVEQHLMLLNLQDSGSVEQNAMNDLMYSREYSEILEDYELEFSLGIVLQDLKKVSANKASFQLVNKEITVKHNNLSDFIEKTFASTTKCACCHGKNPNYKRVDKVDGVMVPQMLNIWEQRAIKYSTGGLRSVSSEETEALVRDALERTGLDIKIKLGYSNPVSNIIPVYHSTLEMTHKNRTPYFFEPQRSFGKGINNKQAYFSAAFEMFERLSARYFGQKEIVCGSYSTLKDYCADILQMVSLHEKVDTVYDSFDADKDVDWIWAYSLVDDKPKLLPASLAFLSHDMFKGNFAPNGSSGMSAGATLKDAILQGLFELIEHDAWMIGQANTVRLPIITYDGLSNTTLKNHIEQIEAAGFKVISRDYTNDLGIPVIRTWISNPNSYVHYATGGFGASIYPEIALERSITEAVQSGASSHLKDVVNYNRPIMLDLINARDGLYSLFYFQQKDIRPLGMRKDIKSLHKEDVDTVDEAIKYVISRIRAVEPDADVLFVDFTRDGIGVPAVKVFVTKGLQILREPLLSTSDRLINFQKTMGYSQHETQYDELYMAAYPH